MKENKRTKMQTFQKFLDIVMVGSYLLLLAIYLLDRQWLASLWIFIATIWMLFANWQERRAKRMGDAASEAVKNWCECLDVLIAVNREGKRQMKRCEGLVRAVRRAVWAIKAVRQVRKIVNDDTLCADAMVANIGEVVK